MMANGNKIAVFCLQAGGKPVETLSGILGQDTWLGNGDVVGWE
jgi:hypothetical protein